MSFLQLVDESVLSGLPLYPFLLKLVSQFLYQLFLVCPLSSQILLLLFDKGPDLFLSSFIGFTGVHACLLLRLLPKPEQLLGELSVLVLANLNGAVELADDELEGVLFFDGDLPRCLKFM